MKKKYESVKQCGIEKEMWMEREPQIKMKEEKMLETITITSMNTSISTKAAGWRGFMILNGIENVNLSK